METIIFKQKGDPLFVKSAVRGGVIAAPYTITLIEADGYTHVAKYRGDNIQVNDDKFKLPIPVNVNSGRLIRWIVDFKGVDLANSSQYEIVLELYQGTALLNTLSETGTISGEEQNIIRTVKLMGE